MLDNAARKESISHRGRLIMKSAVASATQSAFQKVSVVTLIHNRSTVPSKASISSVLSKNSSPRPFASRVSSSRSHRIRIRVQRRSRALKSTELSLAILQERHCTGSANDPSKEPSDRSESSIIAAETIDANQSVTSLSAALARK